MTNRQSMGELLYQKMPSSIQIHSSHSVCRRVTFLLLVALFFDEYFFVEYCYIDVHTSVSFIFVRFGKLPHEFPRTLSTVIKQQRHVKKSYFHLDTSRVVLPIKLPSISLLCYFFRFLHFIAMYKLSMKQRQNGACEMIIWFSYEFLFYSYIFFYVPFQKYQNDVQLKFRLSSILN